MTGLYLVELELENFGPFRGKHRIKLEPGVYAVTASRETDADHSNYVGKSTLLSAIPFLLFGWHLADTEDGLVTDGEKHAAVRCKLSDGSEIERARKKATRLECSLPGRGAQKGDGAQAALLAHLGMSQADYFATSFFEQKKVSQFVTMDPGPRLQLVRGWLDLGKLQRAEELAWDEAKAAQVAYDALTVADREADAYWARLKAEYAIEEEPREKLALIVAELKASIARSEAIADEAQAELAVASSVEAKVRFDKLCKEGIELKARFDAMPVVEPEELAQAYAKQRDLNQQHGALLADAARARKAGACEFDGMCPVAGINCPAKDQINATGKEALVLASQLETEAARYKLPIADAQLEVQALHQRQRQRADLGSQLVVLRRQAAEAQEAAAAAPIGNARLLKWDQTPAERLALANSRIRTCHEALASTRVDLENGIKLEAKRADAQAKAAASRQLAAARATAKIYKKSQRVVAEKGMAEVERRANRNLQTIGAPLEAQLRWAREGNDLAHACDECGAPYPKSAKVKECATCGAKRGPNQIDRLDVALSDWSGAAEDLAGVAIQLAAAGWLRQRRGMSWASACIDEPFGSLDVKHRRDLAQHLVSLLGTAGFAQAFIVAHDRGIMAALPHRIELVGSTAGTKIA